MSGARLAAELGRAMGDAFSGAVEWRDEKRRRLFFFVKGSLALVQSNLKSESPERVMERFAPAPELLGDLVAATRLREALVEPRGEVALHPGAAPPSLEALDLPTLLWVASDALPPPPTGVWPRVPPEGAPLLARLPLAPDVVRYLLELDGTRPVDEVLEFGPEEPELLSRALALGALLGAVRWGPAAAGGAAAAPARPPASPAPGVRVAPVSAPLAAPPPVTAAPTPPAARPTSAQPVTVDDIADFIRGALDADEASVSPEAAAPRQAEAVQGRSMFSGNEAPAAPDLDDDASPYGGASATIQFGASRAAAPPPDPEADATAFFGSALARIRAAKDHFGVLGTGWQDAPETHRRAYFALAQRLHPDRLAGESAVVRAVAEELFDRVRAAWETLGDDVKREAYIARVIRGEKSEDELAMEQVRRILDAEADFKRGLAELNGGRLPAAHELFKRATEASPEEPDFAAHHAYTAFRLAFGRDDAAASEAAKRLGSITKAAESRDALWVLHGIVLRMTGHEAGARQAFVHALKLKPSNPDAVREMRRLQREREEAPAPAAEPGFLSRLFKRK